MLLVIEPLSEDIIHLYIYCFHKTHKSMAKIIVNITAHVK